MRYFYLRLVFVASGKLAWSFLLTVEVWFGLVCLGWRIGLVLLTYGSPCLEIGFGHIYLPHRKSKRQTASKIISIVSIKDASK